MTTSFYTEEELTSLGLSSYGSNVLISRKCSIYSPQNISLGNNVRIDDFCVLSGKITIGNYVHIAAASLLFAGEHGILMKDFSCLSSRCAVYADSDDFNGKGMTNPMVPDKFRKVYGGQVIIGKHVVVGSGSTILPGVEIGEGSSVGSMGFVNKSLKPWGVYIGAPVRRLKDRDKNILELEKEFISQLSPPPINFSL
jgi:galactoside O-acetyltransferase